MVNERVVIGYINRCIKEFEEKKHEEITAGIKNALFEITDNLEEYYTYEVTEAANDLCLECFDSLKRFGQLPVICNTCGADRSSEQWNIAKEEGKKDKLIGEARNIKKQMDILYVSGEDQYSINQLQEVLDQKNAEIEEQKALLDVLYAKRDKR